MRSVLRAHRHTLLTLGVAVVVISASRSVRAGLLPLWADHLGISASTTSLIFAGSALIDIAMFYPGGWLMDRRGRSVVAVPIVLGVAVACLLLPLVTSAAGLAAILVLISFANGLGSGIVMTLGADTAPVVGPRAVPRWLAAVRRHRQHRRPAAGRPGELGGAPGDRLRGGRDARAGRGRVGGLLDPAAGPRSRPQPIVMTTSLEVAPVSVSAIRNRVSPPWPVWM